MLSKHQPSGGAAKPAASANFGKRWESRHSVMDPAISTNAGETAVCAMSGGDVPDTDQRFQTLSMLPRPNLTFVIFPKTLYETYHDKDTRTPKTLSGHRHYRRETHTRTGGICQDTHARMPQTLSRPR